LNAFKLIGWKLISFLRYISPKFCRNQSFDVSRYYMSVLRATSVEMSVCFYVVWFHKWWPLGLATVTNGFSKWKHNVLPAR